MGGGWQDQTYFPLNDTKRVAAILCLTQSYGNLVYDACVKLFLKILSEWCARNECRNDVLIMNGGVVEMIDSKGFGRIY